MASTYRRAMTARPSSSLRSDYAKFSRMCHEMREPVLITVNGEDDLVVMPTQVYNDMIDRMELTATLLAAEKEFESGVPTIPAEEVFQKLRDIIHERAKG